MNRHEDFCCDYECPTCHPERYQKKMDTLFEGLKSYSTSDLQYVINRRVEAVKIKQRLEIRAKIKDLEAQLKALD